MITCCCLSSVWSYGGLRFLMGGEERADGVLLLLLLLLLRWVVCSSYCRSLPFGGRGSLCRLTEEVRG